MQYLTKLPAKLTKSKVSSEAILQIFPDIQGSRKSKIVWLLDQHEIGVNLILKYVVSEAHLAERVQVHITILLSFFLTTRENFWGIRRLKDLQNLSYRNIFTATTFFFIYLFVCLFVFKGIFPDKQPLSWGHQCCL